MLSGDQLITEERKRHFTEEGYTAESDQIYVKGELVKAAIAYAVDGERGFTKRSFWPWPLSLFKPTPNDRVRELVKAGALIAAEIDRLQFINQKQK